MGVRVLMNIIFSFCCAFFPAAGRCCSLSKICTILSFLIRPCMLDLKYSYRSIHPNICILRWSHPILYYGCNSVGIFWELHDTVSLKPKKQHRIIIRCETMCHICFYMSLQLDIFFAGFILNSTGYVKSSSHLSNAIVIPLLSIPVHADQTIADITICCVARSVHYS